MSAGKGIAGSALARAFDDRKAGIADPRARDPEKKLEKLIKKSSNKADRKNEIPLTLIDAPVINEPHEDKENLPPEMSDQRKEGIKEWETDAFQKFKKLHSEPPFFFSKILRGPKWPPVL